MICFFACRKERHVLFQRELAERERGTPFLFQVLDTKPSRWHALRTEEAEAPWAMQLQVHDVWGEG